MSGSVDRTVTVPIPSAEFGQVLAWPNKNPGDDLSFSVDFTAWLADAYPGQTAVIALAAAQVVLGDTIIGLVGSVVITGGIVTVQIAGGTPGVVYGVLVTMQTATTPVQVKIVPVTIAVNGGQAVTTTGTSSVISLSGPGIAAVLAGQDLSASVVTPAGGVAETLAALAAAASGALQASGGTVTGTLSVQTPTAAAHAAPKSYVDAAVSNETTRATTAEATLTTAVADANTVAGAAASAAASAVGSLATESAARVSAVSTLTAATAAAQATANAAIPASQKGASSGVAPLDGTAKVPLANLPASVVGAQHYLGVWNAAANTPAITSGVTPADGLVGGYYICDVAGTTAVNGTAVWAVGDWIVWDGTRWDKLDGQANPVASVAGRQGVVTLTAADIGGLGAPATAAFGTTTGSVADGGVLAAETAARVAGDVVAGTITGAGAIILETGAGSVTLAGTVTTTLVAGTATALPAGSAPTISLSGSPQVLSIGVPAGSVGQAGATGAAVTIPITLEGSWNATTNVASTGATLTAGGGGGTAGQSFYTATAGTSSVTGTSTVYAVGDYLTCTAAGTAFFKQAGQSNTGTVGQVVIPNASNPTLQVSDNGSPDGNWYINDPLGNIALQVTSAGVGVGTINGLYANFGSLSVTSFSAGSFGAANVTATGTFSITSKLAILDSGDGTGAYYFCDPLGFWVTKVDAGGVTSQNGTFANLTVLGTLTAPGIGPSTTSFSVTDIAGLNTSALSAGDAVRQVANTTAQRATKTYNHVIEYGQSLSMGQEGCPALSTAPILDAFMWGQSMLPSDPSGSTATTFATVGDNLLHPLGATSMTMGGALETIQTGALINMQGVSVIQGSGNGTITWTSVGTTTGSLTVGLTFDCSGFTGTSTAMNSTGLSPNAPELLTIGTLTSNSIVTTTVPPASATNVNGITLGLVSYNGYGENMAAGALKLWRAQQLAKRELDSDPTRLLGVNATGVTGQSIAALSKGATPDYYNRVPTCAQGMRTAALAVNPSATTGCPAIIYRQGEADVSSGTSQEAYLAAMIALYGNLVTDLKAVHGQTLPPPFFTQQPFNAQDFDSTNTERMPINMAILRFCGLAPTIGYGTPNTPDVYLVCPGYFQPDHSLHYTSNGYRWTASYIGKALAIVQELGRSWRPLYPIKVVNRGLQILVVFSVPVPPLTAAPSFVGSVLTNYTDLGFTVTDDSAFAPSGGGVPIVSVTIVSDSVVEIIIGRALSTNPYVWYADAGRHGGNGNLVDSDPTVALDSWVFTAGSGQPQCENVPGYVGNAYPLYNYSVAFALPIVAG